MNDPNIPTTRSTFEQHAIESLKKVPHGRAYAADTGTATMLGALCFTWQRERAETQHKSFDRADFAKEVLAPLSKFERSLVQDRPPDEEQFPEWPKDEWTGAPVANPFAKETLNLTEQAAVIAANPRLAELMKQRANGVTFSLVQQLEREKEKRQRIREIQYDEHTHKANVFATDNLGAKSAMVATHRDFPELIAFLKREATTPVELQSLTGNLSAISQIVKHNPGLGGLIKKAKEIYNGWLDQDRAALKRQAEDAQAQLQKLEPVTAK